MGFPEDRDKALQREAIEAWELADALDEWVADHAEARRNVDVGAVSREQEFRLLQLRREARDLFGLSKVPAAAAVYGASQTGKSLFVSRVVEPRTSDDSPLGPDDVSEGYIRELSFERDVNPQCGSNEATALVTRFSVRDRMGDDLPPVRYPVVARALTRAEWLKVLARGFASECESEGRGIWNEETLESLFQSIEREHPAQAVDRQWRLDLSDAYADLHEIEPLRFRPEESFFSGLCSRYPLTGDGYVELAARLFWEGPKFPLLTEWFVKVANFLTFLASKQRDNCMAVHWAAVRFLLDSQHKDVQQEDRSRWRKRVSLSEIREEEENGWYILKYAEGSASGLSLEKLQIIQSALLEIAIPVLPERLTPDWKAALENIDLLDIPGARSDGGNYATLDHEKRLAVVKRGKVDYLFDRYIRERQIQTILLLSRYGNQEVRGKIKSYLDKWGRFRYGKDVWPRKLPPGTRPGLFIGMTGIDEEIGDRTVTGDLYDVRIKNLCNEVLLEIMTDYGGSRFDNVYPIRYPGSWDKNATQRRALGPERWEKAGQAFASSEWVRRHVAEPEARWAAAMRDVDGGLSLISRGFLAAASNEQKRDLLKRHLDSVNTSLTQLAQSWYVDPNSNERREARIRLASRILDWLTDDETLVDRRIQAIEDALCCSEGDVLALAEPGASSLSRSSQRPEPLEKRLKSQLRSFLDAWSNESVMKRWERHADAPHCRGLAPDDFARLIACLGEYLGSEQVFSQLHRRILSIVSFGGDEPLRRHARREFIRLTLNDYFTNPGPARIPLEPVHRLNGHDFGLMQTFVARWAARLPACLAAGVGDETVIPSGNEELKRSMQRFAAL
ncbi:MAG TPA: virulence factor SrfC family protein [Pirellulaceae bacterium]|jgi:hypothetical protein|nr:virulence factor SrfC family protein [Pirellulaceae bacterium]